MKKRMLMNLNKIRNLKKVLFLTALTFSVFSSKAQSLTMSFGITNAATVQFTPSTLTYNVTIPFFASSLTGNFKFTKSNLNCPLGTFKSMQVNNFSTGAFIANNGNSNTNYVSLPAAYTFPVGTTSLKVQHGCSTAGGPGGSTSSSIVKIVVTKLLSPSLNVVLTPYCQEDKFGNFTNYFGYKVSGTVANRNGLRLKVMPDNLSACPAQTYWDLNTTFTFTGDTFNAGSGFYSCNYATWYNVYLEYVYTPYGANNPVVFAIADNTYGWHNHRWRKKIGACFPIAESDPKLEKFVQKELSIYPNPTEGIVKLDFVNQQKEIKSVKVYDISNVQLLELNDLKSNEIDLSTFKKGIYFIHIETNGGVFKGQVVKN